jgi:hypothetical protein
MTPKRVLAPLVFEEIVDALVFEQLAHVVEV